MASEQRLVESRESPGPEAAERNRWTARVLLTIVLVLVVATILAGIRW